MSTSSLCTLHNPNQSIVSNKPEWNVLSVYTRPKYELANSATFALACFKDTIQTGHGLEGFVKRADGVRTPANKQRSSVALKGNREARKIHRSSVNSFVKHFAFRVKAIVRVDPTLLIYVMYKRCVVHQEALRRRSQLSVKYARRCQTQLVLCAWRQAPAKIHGC